MKPFYERYWKNKRNFHDFSYKWPVVKRFLPKEKKVTLLDYGCGSGLYLRKMLEFPNLKIIGADVSEKLIGNLKKQFPKQQFVKLSEDKRLPFATNSFDFIICLDVIEHVYDVELLLSEFNRILKKDGELIITTPYHGIFKNIVLSLFFFDEAFNPVGPHIRFFTIKSLSLALEKAKFKVLHTVGFGRWWPLWRGLCIVVRNKKRV